MGTNDFVDSESDDSVKFESDESDYEDLLGSESFENCSSDLDDSSEAVAAPVKLRMYKYIKIYYIKLAG